MSLCIGNAHPGVEVRRDRAHPRQAKRFGRITDPGYARRLADVAVCLHPLGAR